ncbi:hypothetical protein IMSAGC021_01580 [Muribaculaceae bacterium]|nr:hypothetical protein IMSAGC021_01580 [Muribaculaceae bacterium]
MESSVIWPIFSSRLILDNVRSTAASRSGSEGIAAPAACKEQAAEVTVKNVIRCFNISAKCYEIYIVTMTDADESGLLLNHVKSLFCQRDFCDTVS